MSNEKKIHSGEIVDNSTYYSLKQICDICDVHAEYVLEMVGYGILQPEGKAVELWQFSSDQMQRSKKALRLQHDLELNLAGVALALDLLEEVERSQQQLRQMRHLLKILHGNSF